MFSVKYNIYNVINAHIHKCIYRYTQYLDIEYIYRDINIYRYFYIYLTYRDK